MKLLSTMGLAGVIRALGPEWQLDATFLPTQLLLPRIRAGERGDLAILTADGAAELVAGGVLLGQTDLARSHVGIAVRAGAPHPDISSTDAFVAALLAAKSIVMSRAGASGIFFGQLLERLGIADAVRAKATILPSGFTAEPVARGEAELAVQQVSELMVVPGVEIVGRLPAEIEGVTVFSAGVFREATNGDAARQLLAALADPGLHPLFTACGLEPAGGAAPIRA